MRTNIDIDEALIADVMKATGAKTKKEAVDRALRLQLRLERAQARLSELRGTIEWEGDLEAMRRDAPREW